MRQAVIIFTRVPEAGRTKTRMMPHLTPKQCELLHTCFLEDIRKECETCSADVFVYYTLEKNINEPIIKSIFGKQTKNSLNCFQRFPRQKARWWHISCKKRSPQRMSLSEPIKPLLENWNAMLQQFVTHSKR